MLDSHETPDVRGILFMDPLARIRLSRDDASVRTVLIWVVRLTFGLARLDPERDELSSPLRSTISFRRNIFAIECNVDVRSFDEVRPVFAVLKLEARYEAFGVHDGDL